MAMLGRLELVEWLNSVLQSDYLRIEALSDGVAFLQLVDACHPGKAALSKLKFDARQEQDYVHNLGLLEDAFRRCKIPRAVDVLQLSRCSFQYNLEMLQFLHSYVDKHYPTAPDEHPGYARRLEALRRQCRAQRRRDAEDMDFSKPELQNHGFRALEQPPHGASPGGGGSSTTDGAVSRRRSLHVMRDSPVQRVEWNVHDFYVQHQEEEEGQGHGLPPPPPRQPVEVHHEEEEEEEEAMEDYGEEGPDQEGSLLMMDDETARMRAQELEMYIKSLRNELGLRVQEKQDKKVRLLRLLQERDFYFAKLRSVELLASGGGGGSSSTLSAEVLRVLARRDRLTSEGAPGISFSFLHGGDSACSFPPQLLQAKPLALRRGHHMQHQRAKVHHQPLAAPALHVGGHHSLLVLQVALHRLPHRLHVPPGARCRHHKGTEHIAALPQVQHHHVARSLLLAHCHSTLRERNSPRSLLLHLPQKIRIHSPSHPRKGPHPPKMPHPTSSKSHSQRGGTTRQQQRQHILLFLSRFTEQFRFARLICSGFPETARWSLILILILIPFSSTPMVASVSVVAVEESRPEESKLKILENRIKDP